MNISLRDTVDIMHRRDIEVALDMGVHEACAIDSNCPKAIELRRMMASAGITLAELLDGYAELTAPDPIHVDYAEFDNISTKASINIGGQSVDIDLSDVVNRQVKLALQEKISTIEYQATRLKSLGKNLYNSYLNEIKKNRDERTLPQLVFPATDLTANRCYVNGGNSRYSFYLETEYNPVYIIDNGIRYELSARDKGSIARVPAYVLYDINPDHNFYRRPMLLGSDLRKLQHYHGNSTDCWGNVPMLTVWDGSIRQLRRDADTLSNSLRTVNFNSLMVRHPNGMPEAGNLIIKGRRMGREGDVVQPDSPSATTGDIGWQTQEQPDDTTLPRWGRRRE